MTTSFRVELTEHIDGKLSMILINKSLLSLS